MNDSQPWPDEVQKHLNDCAPPTPDYSGIVFNAAGAFGFVNGQPAPGAGIWGTILYAGYQQERQAVDNNKAGHHQLTGWRADGDANFYTISADGNWWARVQMNGEMLEAKQRRAMDALVNGYNHLQGCEAEAVEIQLARLQRRHAELIDLLERSLPVLQQEYVNITGRPGVVIDTIRRAISADHENQ